MVPMGGCFAPTPLSWDYNPLVYVASKDVQSCLWHHESGRGTIFFIMEKWEFQSRINKKTRSDRQKWISYLKPA